MERITTNGIVTPMGGKQLFRHDTPLMEFPGFAVRRNRFPLIEPFPIACSRRRGRPWPTTIEAHPIVVTPVDMGPELIQRPLRFDNAVGFPVAVERAKPASFSLIRILANDKFLLAVFADGGLRRFGFGQPHAAIGTKAGRSNAIRFDGKRFGTVLTDECDRHGVISPVDMPGGDGTSRSARGVRQPCPGSSAVLRVMTPQ